MKNNIPLIIISVSLVFLIALITNYQDAPQFSPGEEIISIESTTPQPIPTSLQDPLDMDEDNIRYTYDNCPNIANPDQKDSDSDGVGDLCDSCPLDPQNDLDNDGICGNIDSCPNTATSSISVVNNQGCIDVPQTNKITIRAKSDITTGTSINEEEELPIEQVTQNKITTETIALTEIEEEESVIITYTYNSIKSNKEVNTQHSIKLNKITIENQKITGHFTIESDPIHFSISQGQEKLIQADQDSNTLIRMFMPYANKDEVTIGLTLEEKEEFQNKGRSVVLIAFALLLLIMAGLTFYAWQHMSKEHKPYKAEFNSPYSIKTYP